MRAKQVGGKALICLALLGLYLFAYSKPFSGPLHVIPVDKTSEVLLVDKDRRVVHKWNVDSPRAYLLRNGDLMALHGTHSKRDKKRFKSTLNKIARYDWNGNEIWSYEHPAKLHHDFAVFDEGIYLLSHKYEKGFFRTRSVKGVPSEYRLRSDSVVKIDLQGHVQWEWTLDPQLFDIVGCKNRLCQKNVKRKSRTLDWTHFNSLKIIPVNKHFTHGHKAFRPGNLLIVSLNWHQILILDTQEKSIVWEYPTEGEPEINGAHEASMIPQGYQGEGNIIFFENGWENPAKGSSVVKVLNPITREITWKYQADGFFSEHQGSVQRLSNGNTFISSDYQRTCFEVSSERQIQWSYQVDNHIYRCRRYEAGYLQ